MVIFLYCKNVKNTFLLPVFTLCVYFFNENILDIFQNLFSKLEVPSEASPKFNKKLF